MSSDSVLEAKITLVQVAWKKGLKTVAEAGGWPKRVAKTLAQILLKAGMSQRCHSWRVKFSGATPNLLGNHIQRMSQLTINTHEHVLTSPSLFLCRYFPQTRGVASRDHVVSSCRQSQRPVV
jgi:hypothetical protein